MADQAPPPSGVYVSVKPQLASAARLKNFYALAGFRTIDRDDLHVTLMYDEHSDIAQVHGMVVTARVNEDPPVAEVAGYDKFGDEKDCLVLKLKSPQLDSIHDELKALGLKHSYASFRPHITLSYDGKDVKTAGLPQPEFPILFEPFIKVAPINKDWKARAYPAGGGLRWVFQQTT